MRAEKGVSRKGVRKKTCLPSAPTIWKRALMVCGRAAMASKVTQQVKTPREKV